MADYGLLLCRNVLSLAFVFNLLLTLRASFACSELHRVVRVMRHADARFQGGLPGRLRQDWPAGA